MSNKSIFKIVVYELVIQFYSIKILNNINVKNN